MAATPLERLPDLGGHVDHSSQQAARRYQQ
jgi:hypothetical protein